MANEIIREAAKARNIRLWEIAAELKITDKTFSRQLRTELPEEKQREILKIIENYAGIGKNLDIKAAAAEKRVYLWQIAEKLKMSDSEFSRLLRKDLHAEEKTKILTIIKDLAAGNPTPVFLGNDS